MALADTVIGGRYPVRKCEVVTVTTSALHRQPEWGDNVELLTWTGSVPSGPPDVRSIRSNRSALGVVQNRPSFALHEATMALATLVHRYCFLDVEHYSAPHLQ